MCRPVRTAESFSLAQPAGEGSQPGPQEMSGKATASMVCGILLFLWPFTPIAAVVLGHLALSGDQKKRRAPGRPRNGDGWPDFGLHRRGFRSIHFDYRGNRDSQHLALQKGGNEASAVGTLRTFNTAMVTYATECPKIGYPKDLRSLAADPVTPGTSGVRHFFPDESGPQSATACTAART
jgi:hypothetical protein